MDLSNSILKLYQRFYAQKELLKDAHTLTINLNQVDITEFPTEQAVNEMNRVASYLIGVQDITKVSFDNRVKAVKQAYQNQPFWRELLFDYLDMTLNIEEEKLKDKGIDILTNAQEVMNDIYYHEEQQNEMVSVYASKITAEKFHVDAKELIHNYFKMMKKDANEAWQVLITNPAYFSPIITTDSNGKKVLSPTQAIEENKKLASFLKKLKG